MNGKGIQALIEAFLVILSEISLWMQNRSRGKEPGNREDV
jgi:hypothetical protein